MNELKYGLIGEKLGHSFSPEVHAALGDRDYRLVELAPTELDGFLRERRFEAINVTIPYKTAVIPYLDAIDGAAAAIGAVNTVCRVGDKLYGYNTDFAGMCDLIRRVTPELSGKKALILGSGGTAKTARAVLAHLGAREILTVSRAPKDGVIDYATAEHDHTDADFILNATPVGMYPELDACPIDISNFDRLCGLVDVIYNPLRTDLVLEAKKRAVPAEGGLYMLVSQAIHAREHFTGHAIAPELAESVFASIRQSKENIVLVGMPGCGKTTVGRKLAQSLDRPFIDTDELIVKDIGRSIPEIFSQRGEEAFRDIESEVIRRSCKSTRGAVIATGGGAILRAENIRALRRVGRIYFLDRELENIKPTDGRPLSRDREALKARYAERYPLYLASADAVIAPNEELHSRIEAIRKDFLSK